MMKRICVLLLALNLCIVLFACGGGNEPQNTDTQTGNGSETAEVINTGDRSNKDIAVQWLNDLFSDSNFHKLAEQYAYYEDTSELLSASVFEDILKQLTESRGSFLQINEDSFVSVEEHGYETVSGTCTFSGGDVTAYLSFGADGVIYGFDFDPPVDTMYLDEGETLYIGDEKAPAAGKLLTAEGAAGDTLVILIPGSGNAGYNGAIGLCTPMRDICENLLENGISTFRYTKSIDKLDSSELPAVTPYDEYCTDVINIVRYFSEEGSPHFYEKIYLAGHSMGGYLLPGIVGALDGEELSADGLIFLSAPAESFDTVLLWQAENMYEHYRGTDEEQTYKTQLDAYKAAVGIVRSIENYQEQKDFMILGAGAPYWLWLKDYDPLSAISGIELPMLFLYAQNDTNVSPAQMDIWKDVLNSRAEFEVFGGLNHSFIKGSGWAEDYFTEERVPKAVTDRIADFITE